MLELATQTRVPHLRQSYRLRWDYILFRGHINAAV